MLIFVPLAALGLYVLQATAPDLTPAGQDLMLNIVKFLALLGPLYTRYVTEWLRNNIPAIGNANGTTVVRNVSVLLFGALAVFGLTALPNLSLPVLPASADAFDWLGYASALLTVAGAGLAWFVGGAMWVHAKLKGDA